ncbi:uncharacterized protein [Macaca nemestrina]|uniref:uncharacterized protein isoform X1 n=1 Tax=Macaca nemestrina TaxID=9545 RepID=UPI0039B987C8
MLCCPTVGVSSPTGASRKLNPQLEAWASPQPKWPPASQRATTTQPLATASRKTTTSRSQMDSPSQQLTPPPRPSADQLSSSLGGCGRPAAPTCSRTLCEAVLQLSGALPLSELLCCLTWQCHGSSGHRRSWVGSALASRLGTGLMVPAANSTRLLQPSTAPSQDGQEEALPPRGPHRTLPERPRAPGLLSQHRARDSGTMGVWGTLVAEGCAHGGLLEFGR